ncbi:MAG: NADP-dependent isocitrate dehydrogenase [Saprospiraceae bacterium]|nr:NADP-dependent isocitrate dehydrogenase [Saprospiraceae bacterium]
MPNTTAQSEVMPEKPVHAQPVPITVTYGDGIGLEIMPAVLRILDAAGARIAPEIVEVGEKVYKSGITSGIPESAWASIRRTRILLKAPFLTPQGSGYKSLTVTMRKTLGMFANVRPCVTYHPYVQTNHPSMDLVIIRENEEDLYAGIEHRQTDEVYQCLKLISIPGSEKIIRYAFEYARANGRKKVTCMTKDNIMKITDGTFSRLFREIGAEYPDIQQEHMIIDIGAARLAERPEHFDVVVTLNLYGDILSDIAAEVSGSVGLAGSANIGQEFAMFEAVHGSAPDIAGKGIANPSGLLLAALQMLVHIGQSDVAETIHNAWLSALEEGIHTGDIFNEPYTRKRVGTEEFAQAVIDRLGSRPKQLPAVNLSKNAGKPVSVQLTERPRAKKELVGVDVFLHWPERAPDALAELLLPAAGADMPLNMITNRGIKVYPEGNPATFCTDHWRCRFKNAHLQPVSYASVLELLHQIHDAGLNIIKTENLYTFNGEPGFSLGQGE